MTEVVQNDRTKDRLREALGRVFALGVLMIAIAATSFAQREDDVIKVETDLVTFEVSVTDAEGRPVRNLSAEDFQVFEDDQERRPDFFEAIRNDANGRPLSIVLALDMSGSMTTEELERLKTAINSFAARLADYNSYFAVTTFAMDVNTLLSFTNRRQKLESSIAKLKRDRDGLSTHAYDAVDHAVRMLRTKGPKYSMNRLTRRVVVLITDGFPVGDVVSPETVIERANAGETSVFALILPSYSRFQTSKRPLLTPLEASGIFQRTGGRSFYATGKGLEPLFKALEEELTASYALAFYPTKEKGTANAFRNVRIISRKGLVVKQNRAGYNSQSSK
jgi:Ca-activated chloride channel homolog